MDEGETIAMSTQPNRPVSHRASLPRIQALFIAASTALCLALPVAAQQGNPPPDFLITARSSMDFDATVAALKQAIEGENLMVIHEINPQQMLRMVGMRVGGMRQILFFHPRYMKQIVETNANAGIEPPLKLIVMERPDGSVMVRYENPEHQFGPYSGLESLATELGGIFDRVVGAVRG